ncbi:hypothetical protein BS78_K032600 [Paspalum vaginatum]|uniref:Myb/SANT-like domain-containing protein n=1 Tax=Paspalum vaginatum TaxID=158149 RepID=A0A9W7X8Z9_9POAL|nr:hypothetical protein BS78_K032600 [Paspalum vaginatum]
MNTANQRSWSEQHDHHPQSQGFVNVDANLGTTKRAKWSLQMKVYLINLLKDHDVPGFRTQNARSKEAWTNIFCRVNTMFGTSFSLNQVKQKEQDLKKDYRSVRDLLAESGFGWDPERIVVDAPPSVWASFAARKNSKDALHWQDRPFPYYDALAPLYDGELYIGMDHYSRKTKNPSLPSMPAAHVADTYQSPSPTLNAPCESGLQFPFDEEVEEVNLDFSQRSTTPVNHTQVAPSSTQISTEVPECQRGKKQKGKSSSSNDGFHERYLKLKKEKINRFAAIEEKKLEDPYNINKCILVLEGLYGLQMGEILVASDIFKSKENRELAWIKREIDRQQTLL